MMQLTETQDEDKDDVVRWKETRVTDTDPSAYILTLNNGTRIRTRRLDPLEIEDIQEFHSRYKERYTLIWIASQVS